MPTLAARVEALAELGFQPAASGAGWEWEEVVQDSATGPILVGKLAVVAVPLTTRTAGVKR